MSRLLRGAAVAALTVAACAVAGAAGAQSYDRLVVFGDSLSDNGNLFAAIGTPPAPYVDGRFSSGPVFTEQLGFTAAGVGAPITADGSFNYAYGGARTDTTTFPMGPPGMRTQLAMYTGAGGTFGAGDLVSILGGANNIFGGLAAFGALPPGDPRLANPTGFMAPVALSAASDITTIVGGVAGAGAGTILVTNLPKLSLTPQFRGTSAGALADYTVGVFNSALATGLTGAAAANAGSNIILMDLYKVGDAIVANAAAFGISNVTEPCFNGVTVCADPDSYFYFDGVHPTEAGHSVIARLADDYLYYGDHGAQSALQGETAFRHREDGLDKASERLSGREAWAAGTAITVGAHYDQTETAARGLVSESESDGYGARMALESGPSGSLRFGVAGSMAQAEVTSDTMVFDVESLALDIYGGWRSAGGMFVNGVMGVAHDNYDGIERLTSLAPITHLAETTGVSSGVKVQAGTWLEMGGVALSPRVAVSWVSSDVDGYTEQGPAAQYVYSDRTVESMSAEAALRLEGGLAGDFGFFLEGGYRDALDDRSDAVGVNVYGSPSHTLYREVEDPLGGQMLLNGGVHGTVFSRVKLEVGYRGRFGDSTDSHMGGINLTLPL